MTDETAQRPTVGGPEFCPCCGFAWDERHAVKLWGTAGPFVVPLVLCPLAGARSDSIFTVVRGDGLWMVAPTEEMWQRIGVQP